MTVQVLSLIHISMSFSVIKVAYKNHSEIADKTELQAAIDNAVSLDQKENYTDVSYTHLADMSVYYESPGQRP